MHWVESEELVLNDEVYPVVLLLEHDRVADQRVVGCSIHTLGKGHQGWLSVVDVDGTVVQEPAEDRTVIGSGDISDVTRGHRGGRAREC